MTRFNTEDGIGRATTFGKNVSVVSFAGFNTEDGIGRATTEQGWSP